MRLNSEKSLALARAVLREHGGSWENVMASGHVREDGVVVIKRPAGAAAAAREARLADRTNGRAVRR